MCGHPFLYHSRRDAHISGILVENVGLCRSGEQGKRCLFLDALYGKEIPLIESNHWSLSLDMTRRISANWKWTYGTEIGWIARIARINWNWLVPFVSHESRYFYAVSIERKHDISISFDQAAKKSPIWLMVDNSGDKTSSGQLNLTMTRNSYLKRFYWIWMDCGLWIARNMYPIPSIWSANT